MNAWVEKSIKMARGNGYLDKLQKVYPVSVNAIRKLDPQEKQDIIQAYKKKNARLLIETLLSFERFPIDEPYIGFFRKDNSAMKRNPKTVKRIGEQLFKLGVEGIIEGIERPKSASRQFGQYFKIYIQTLGFPVLPRRYGLKH